MDGCENEAWKLKLEIQCSIVGFWCHYGATSNASITIDVIEHRNNMYVDDPTSLFDSTQKLFLFCERHQLVKWSSTDPRSAPCDFNMLQSWARRLTVRVNGMAVYLILALKNIFPLMPVSSSVDDQGPVHSNGVGIYSMKIPKSMDRESVLFRIGQWLLIHITQEDCSGLSHLWRRLLMRKTQQGFIATLYRPPHASSLYGVGGLW